MQLNGAIDRDLFGVDIKSEIISTGTLELPVKGCCAFSVTNLGNVPLRINGVVTLNTGSCNTRTFPNYLLLDYARNIDLEWLSDGIAEPDARVEVNRIYIVRKETNINE